MIKRCVTVLVICSVAIIAAVGSLNAWQKNRAILDREMAQKHRDRQKQWIASEMTSLKQGLTSSIKFYSVSNTAELLREFSGMREIKKLVFNSSEVTDDCMELVAGLPELQELVLYCSSPRVSNRGLGFLKEHPTLTVLRLSNTGVTDDGLETLESIPQLEYLVLYQFNHANRTVPLTDSAVVQLKKLHLLKRLTIGGGWLSKTSIEDLNNTLNCRIFEKNDIDDDEW
jgi:hypothetical protein